LRPHNECGHDFFDPCGCHACTWDEATRQAQVEIRKEAVKLTTEELAAKFHEIYQQEAKRQGDVRHKDSYDELPENIKEFDRVLACYVERLIAEAQAETVERCASGLDIIEAQIELIIAADPRCFPAASEEVQWILDFQEYAKSAMKAVKAIRALSPDPLKALERVDRPKIMCLCGSTRFKDAFDEANYQETMAGTIILTVGFFMHATGNKHGEDIGATPEQKIALDELHKRKIDLADEVYILNVGGYVGESTRSEWEYAVAHGKPVRWLEPDKALATWQEERADD
jgi:hypothetical protein